MKTLITLLLLLPSVAFANGVSGGSRGGYHEYLNFLLIMIDDVGRFDLNISGSDNAVEDFSIPVMDILKTQGMTMRNFHASHVCASTRNSVMTGWNSLRTLEWRGPSVTGMNREQPKYPMMINDTRPQYEVGYFGKSGVAESRTPTWNNQRDDGLPPYDMTSGYPWGPNREIRYGFDFFDGFKGTEVSTNNTQWRRAEMVQPEDPGYDPNDSRTWWNYPCASSIDRVNTSFTPSYPYYEGTAECDTFSTEVITDTTKAWIKDQVDSGSPYVAWVSYTTAHTPHSDPALDGSRWCLTAGCPELQQTGSLDSRMMYHLDKEIGYLLMDVDLSNTIVMIVGDNGSSTTSEGAAGREGKGTLTEYGINVGAIILGAGIPANTSTLYFHSVADIIPTLAEMTGFELPTTMPNVLDDGRLNGQTGPAVFSGTSFLSTLRNNQLANNTTAENYTGNQFMFSARDNVYRVDTTLAVGDDGTQDPEFRTAVTYFNCECASEADRIKYCSFTAGPTGMTEQMYTMTRDYADTGETIADQQATRGGARFVQDNAADATALEQITLDVIRAKLADELEFMYQGRTPTALPFSGNPWERCIEEPYIGAQVP